MSRRSTPSSSESGGAVTSLVPSTTTPSTPTPPPSSATTPTTTTPSTPTSVSLSSAVLAERMRARHSASSRFAAVGLLLCVLQGLGWWFVAMSAAPDWGGLLGWQTLYATGLFAPVVAVLAATTIAREAAARDGGTWARPLSPRTAFLARILVLAWQSVLLHAAVTLPLLGVGLLGGLDAPPVARFVTLWLVFSAGSLVPLSLAAVVAPRAGMIATVGLAVAWQILGTVLAESSSWWVQPWTWGVRGLLPVLGVHQNGIRLEPESAVWGWSPWWPALMSVLLAVTVVVVAAARAGIVTEPGAIGLARLRARTASVDPATVDPASVGSAPVVDPGRVDDATRRATRPAARRVPAIVPAGGEVERDRPCPIRAQWALLRGTAIPGLTLVSLVAVALMGLLRDAGDVTGVGTWILVPLGACVLACLAWSANADAWRIAVLRGHPASHAAALLALCAGLLVAVVGWVTIVARMSRGAHGLSVAYPAVSLAVGAMVLTVSLWLVTRFGVGAALVTTLVVLVVSLVFGATWMADGPLWLVGVLGWPLTATTPGRLLVALALALVTTGTATLAWLSALRRAAR